MTAKCSLTGNPSDADIRPTVWPYSTSWSDDSPAFASDHRLRDVLKIDDVERPVRLGDQVDLREQVGQSGVQHDPQFLLDAEDDAPRLGQGRVHERGEHPVG